MSVGLGAMRLSTEADRDDVRGAEVLATAIACGVDLIDTADSYGLDEADTGHNERLVAAALARLDEATRARVAIITKGGLERPGGAWVPNGSARHLQAAAAASAERLGRPPDVYLLHAIDPGTPLATSVRALARIRDAGHARAVGLSNVTPTQLEAALALTPIAAVEVELHPSKLDALRGGLVRMCEERGLRLLAHRPLGGPAGVSRIGRDRVVAAIAQRLGATPCEVVLAWLHSLSPAITTLPGATRVATAASIGRAARLELDDEARAALAARYLAIHRARGAAGSAGRAASTSDAAASTSEPAASGSTSDAAASTSAAASTDGRAASTSDVAASTSAPGASSDGRAASTGDAEREVVMIAGMPASGKSTLAEAYVARGYTRLNRDERGGSLLDLARAVDAELAAGTARIVVDNTYGTRAQRAPVIEIAHAHGVPVRCTWVATPMEQAQANAALRILARHGRLLEEHEHAGEILPRVLHRFARDAEPPRADEGFDAVDEVVPARSPTGTRRALLVELDGVLCKRRPFAAADVAIASEVVAAIAAWSEHAVAVTAWRPQWAAAQRLTEDERTATRIIVDPPTAQPLASRDSVAAFRAAIEAQLGRSIVLLACAHPAGPPTCWCRKPLPGLAMLLARAFDVDLARSLHVGRGPADRGFARRAGCDYADIATGWPTP